jgi:peptidoglycan/LPS O-acetylase OafA/YrhL
VNDRVTPVAKPFHDAAGDLVPPGRLPYMLGIDGLRAIAVMAVLFYHADFVWARGGFLGVEVFFVISGYLITSLLLVEWLRTGTIGLKSFWLRRARRLLPAATLLVLGVSVASLLIYRDALERMLGDVVAAMAYVTNWFLIVRDVSYFESFGRPPLLQHMWSLAVEEQFYILWPLIFTFGFMILKGRDPKRSIRSFFAIVVVGIVASTLLMGFLHTPFEDPSRVYYGTDTRAAGILVGVALSLVWIPWRLPPTIPTRQRVVLNIAGFGALAALIVIFATADEFSTLLFRGGFLVTSLVTAAVIAVTVHPAASLGRILENPVMKWIGTRSYGIYLWHWPVFMVLRPGVDVADRPYLTFAVRLALTLAIAEVSYRYVESPIRRKGLRQWVVDLRRAAGVTTVRGGTIIAASALASLVLISGGLAWGSFIRTTETISAASQAPDNGEALAVSAGTSDPAPSPAPSSTTSTTTAPSPQTDLPLVTIIGDSVVAGAEAVIEDVVENPTVIDGRVDRQFKHADDVADDHRSTGTLGEIVILHLGTNGAFSSQTFDEVMENLEDVDRIIVLTAKVPRKWESSVNRTIAEGAERWPDIEVIDWHTIGNQHPEWFFEDQVHLNGTGMKAYSDLLNETINP